MTQFSSRHLSKRQAAPSIPRSILATLQPPAVTLKHLVIVPGHAIYIGGSDVTNAASDDSQWILEDVQKHGSIATFIRHITHGAELTVKDPEALLIFTGGQTRAHAETTEAMSYARLARAGNIYAQFKEGNGTSTSKTPEFARVTTEDYALDSYQNLLFSIIRFKEFTGHYPSKITVVGFGMKARRYTDVHRASLRWPSSAFHYEGIDNEDTAGADYNGERIGGLEPFVKDSYGCRGALMAKKNKRNPFRRMHPYHTSCPELSEIMEYCPEKNEMFDGVLPWSS